LLTKQVDTTGWQNRLDKKGLTQQVQQVWNNRFEIIGLKQQVLNNRF